MFKMLKYLFVANLYKKAKKQLILFSILLFILILSSSILNDIISATSGINLYVFIGIKWIVILLLLAYILFMFLKIINIATTNPLKKESRTILLSDKPTTHKREYILNKNTLLTESEMILQKYTEEKL